MRARFREERLVKFCTKRFRGNVTDVAAEARVSGQSPRSAAVDVIDEQDLFLRNSCASW
jgi:hypothetical protein